MKKKIIFYIGFSKTGTSFIKREILKKTKNYKYLDFDNYFIDEIFYNKKKLKNFFYSNEFYNFMKVIKKNNYFFLHKNLLNPIRVFRNTKKFSYNSFFSNIKLIEKKSNCKIELLITTRSQDKLLESYFNEFFDYFYLNFNIKNFEDFFYFIKKNKVIENFNYFKLVNDIKKYFCGKFYLFTYEDIFLKRNSKILIDSLKINLRKKINYNKIVKKGIIGTYYIKNNTWLLKLLFRLINKLNNLYLISKLKKININSNYVNLKIVNFFRIKNKKINRVLKSKFINLEYLK